MAAVKQRCAWAGSTDPLYLEYHDFVTSAVYIVTCRASGRCKPTTPGAFIRTS